MALKAKIKDLSEVGEAEQALYKKTEDGYVVEIEPVDGFDLQNISSLKNALTVLKGENEQVKTTLKSFGELDPKEVLKKLDRYEQLKDMNPEKIKKELMIDARNELDNEYKTKLSGMNDQMDKLKSSIKKAARNEILSLIAKEGGTPEFAQSYIESITDVEIKDGNYKLKFLQENGQDRFTFDDKNNPIPYTAEHLIKDLKEHKTFGKMFPTPSNSGAGGPSKYNAGSVREGVKVISASQEGEYLEEIASGKAVVR